MKHNITVGQQVFVVSARYRQSDTVKAEYKVVTKVGNKYFYTGEGWSQLKFCLETLVEVNASNYHDKIYITEQEYLDEVTLSNAWGEFQKATRDCMYKQPAHITTEQLVQITKMLKGE